MHEERDTLRHFLMSNVKYRGSHYVRVLDMYARITSVETDKRVLVVEAHSVPGPSSILHKVFRWGKSERISIPLHVLL